MVEIMLIILGIGYLIYRVAFEIPKDIKRTEGKIDMLSLQVKEINLKLNELNKKLEQKR